MPFARALHETPLVVPARVLDRSRGRWPLGLAALIAAVIVALVVQSTRQRGESARYRTVPIERRTIVQTVEAPAQIDVGERFEVAAPARGRLLSVLVDQGAEVTRGQALAKIDEREAKIDIASARAAEQVAQGRLDDAQAAYDAAVDQRQRAEKLLSLDLAQPRHVAAAKTAEARALGALRAARGERSAAIEKRAAAELSLRERTLRSPASGVVLVAPKRVGGLVGPESGPLFVVGNSLDELIVRAQVAEADIGPVHAGQPAEFTVPAFPDRTFHARVLSVQIEPEQPSGLVSYPVKLVAENPGRVLLPRMTATVRIEVAKAEQVLSVREAALRFSPQSAPGCPPRACVWLSSDGVHLEPVPVAGGITDGETVELRPKDRSLRPGDPVVIGLVPQADAEGEKGSPGITLGGKK